MRIFLLVLALLTTPAIAGVDLVKVDKSERKMYLLDGDTVVIEW